MPTISNQTSEPTVFQKNCKTVASACINDTLDKIKAAEDTGDLTFQEAPEFPLASLVINNRLFPLQSPPRPEIEATNLINHWLQGSLKRRTITLLGIPNLYIVSELIDKLPQGSTLILLDTSAKYLKKLFSCSDLSILISDSIKIHLLCHEDPTALASAFHNIISNETCLSDATYITPAQARTRPELGDIQNSLNAKIRLSAMDRVTVASFADEWLQNCLINLPEISQSPGIKVLFDQFKKKDALIICAGPSLNSSLEYIKEHQKKYLIIAVGTALKPCLNAGIRPHLTIALDSDPKVYRQFMNIEDAPGVLITSYTLFPGIIQMYSSNILPFNSLVTKGFAAWLNNADCEHGFLNVGGTVSLSALDCALRFGCENLFVFGLALSFPEDGTSHAKNSMYQGQKISHGLVKVKGNRHDTVNTTKQFANYIEIMNSYFRDVSASFRGKIFNVNSCGAHIEKLELMRPEEFNSRKHNVAEDFQQIVSSLIKPVNSEIDSLCISTIESFKEICLKSKNLLSSVTSNKTPPELKEFENEIKNCPLCSQLLAPSLKSWCISIENSNDLSPQEMTLSLLNQINGASEWIYGLLENSHQRYKQQTQGVSHG
ncbi:MAG: DUF115 domain-containing protein [Lentisphaeraceae bacterium]|nr:DUF115 domain-containing protein [Lentisphaeraceae bacterium]